MIKLKTGKRYLIGAVGFVVLVACTSHEEHTTVVQANDSGPLVLAICVGFGLLMVVGFGSVLVTWLFRDRQDARRRADDAERKLERAELQARGAVYLNGEYYRPALGQARMPVQADLPMLEGRFDETYR